MLYKGQESSSRELVWVEMQNFQGWGCSKCAWIFNPVGWPAGKTLEQMKENFRIQLAKEFESHACSNHPRTRAASSA